VYVAGISTHFFNFSNAIKAKNAGYLITVESMGVEACDFLCKYCASQAAPLTPKTTRRYF
jgi:hypothetical protein